MPPVTLAPGDTATLAPATRADAHAEATPAAVTTLIVPTPFITAPAAAQAAIIPILMYHHLNELPASATELDLTWTVAPENFELQLQWLAERGYHSITMAQVAAHLKEKKPLPRKPIVISFDDGWAEGYSVAFPLLRRYNFLGVYYVYTNPLGKSQFLSRPQLKEMAGAGMDIEAHTLTHPHLRTLAGDAAFKEIAESKTNLEKEIGKPVTSFAYPFGEHNGAITKLVKRAGFSSAVTIAPGYRQRADELYTLHRIRVSYRDTLSEFAARLPN
ncbi:MAG: polysaccharide deacetylase family protein [Chloroflexi bacterium]|nr:polysaccharide deacetylase family protein [Chloroflexota bacterium]